MELALYCPVYGYYEAEKDRIGRRGDYFTSVSVGPLFGRLLAFQFAEWLSQVSPAPGSGPTASAPVLVEAGAADATLAADILGWLQTRRPQLFECLRYWIVEPSLPTQARQRRTLAPFAGKVSWATDLEEVAGAPGQSETARLRGIIFSNELLDAMPVHRLGWDAQQRRWFEWGVGVRHSRFDWERLEPGQSSLADLPRLPEALLQALPDRFTLEVGSAARTWWRRAAKMLGEGRLATMDYGATLEELLAPERSQGTLRAYLRHGVSGDVLANPGEQDITASVDFSSIRAAGEAEGLITETWLSQEAFLTRVAAAAWKGESQFGDWTAADTRQFQTLTHPDHLGRPFRVLVQRRGPSQNMRDEEKEPGTSQ